MAILIVLAIIGGICSIIGCEFAKYEDRCEGRRSWHDTPDTWLK